MPSVRAYIAITKIVDPQPLRALSPEVMAWGEGIWLLDLFPCLSYWRKEAEKKERDFVSVLRAALQLLKTQEVWPYSVPLVQIKTGEQLKLCSQGARVQVFGLVLVRQSPPTAKGMVFLTIEDESKDHINIVVRPQVYQRYVAQIDQQAFICVQGILQWRDQALSLLLTHVHDARPKQGELIALPTVPDVAFDFEDMSRNYM